MMNVVKCCNVSCPEWALKGEHSHIKNLELVIEAEEQTGKKFDQDKLMYDLLPARTIMGLVNVLTFGAKKYSPENWRKVPNATRRYYAALMRHLEAWRMGEDNDPESGLPHLSHALCCLVFLEQLGEYDRENQK